MSHRDAKGFAFFAGLQRAQCDGELQRYFSRRLNNRQDARELTQEVWLRLCRVKDWERLREPMAYVYRTASNVLAEFRLRQSREPLIFNTEAVDQRSENPSEVLQNEVAERAQAQRDLITALGTLPAAHRRIVWMRLCEQKPFEEIGSEVGLSPGTARRYYFHALKTLWKSEGST